jgi:ferredoxin
MIMKEGAAAPSKCIACGKCAKNCPLDVLEVVDK